MDDDMKKKLSDLHDNHRKILDDLDEQMNNEWKRIRETTSCLARIDHTNISQLINIKMATIANQSLEYLLLSIPDQNKD